MSFKLLMDVHVPKAITTGLRSRGVDVVTAQEVKVDRLSDEDLLRQATAMGRVLFTNDKGFDKHVVGFYERAESFSGVIFASSSLSIGSAIDDLYLMAVTMHPDEMQNMHRRLPI